MDANTLFRLVDFTTAADIVDRSPNAIAVARNGSPTVGVDEVYSYILFNGGKYLTFASSLLNRSNVELTWVVGSIPKSNSSYASPLLDTRPTGTNGNYHILSINQQLTAPYPINYNYPSSSTVRLTKGLIGNDAGPYVIKLQLTDARAKILVNGTVAHEVDTGSALNTANLKLGRSAFNNVVADIQMRLYFFEIKSLT